MHNGDFLTSQLL